MRRTPSLTAAPSKRARSSGRSVVKVPYGSGLPKQLIGTYRYAYNLTINTDVNGIGNYVVYANGMTQPLAGVVTHQPHYFEEIMKLYDHYRVISSSITVKPRAMASGNTGRLTVFMDDDTTPSNPAKDDAAEREGALTRTIENGNLAHTSITKSFNSKNFFGNKAVTDSFYGNVSSNPTENATYVISINGDASAAYVVDIFVDYKAEFTELASVAQSN